MRILVVEICNYIDYPTGGQLSFVRNMLKAFGDELMLVGNTTSPDDAIGSWTKKVIDDVVYDYFAVRRTQVMTKRPIVPERIQSFIYLKKYIRKIIKKPFDRIFIQAPEVLFCLPQRVLNNVCMDMPGVENPLSVSRYPFARYFQSLYDYFFMRKAAKVKYLLATANEQEIANFIKRSRGLINREKLIQFPTRYDEKFYYARDKIEMRQKLHLPASAKIYVTVGRLGWFKGWQLMIDSFSLVYKKIPNSYLYFIGDGEDETKIREYISSMGLSNNIILLGRQLPNVISDFINAANVFIMGSMKEGWSTTLVEACACGVPCVVTNFSSAKEMIQNGKNGYVVEERNNNLFAERMIDCLNLDKETIREFNSKFDTLSVGKLKESLTCIWA